MNHLYYIHVYKINVIYIHVYNIKKKGVWF
nr:MAG TPA: hypothetical protein [Caudoviricetes sp.]